VLINVKCEMSQKQINEEDLQELLLKIESVLVAAGIPSGSVEITFKNSEQVLFSLADDKQGFITPNMSCSLCGGGGTVGVCCEF
jgi:hypothetical protein